MEERNENYNAIEQEEESVKETTLSDCKGAIAVLALAAVGGAAIVRKGFKLAKPVAKKAKKGLGKLFADDEEKKPETKSEGEEQQEEETEKKPEEKSKKKK